MRTRLSAAALFMCMLSACGTSLEASGDVTAGPAEGDSTVIQMLDNAFEPVHIAVPTGERVTLEIVNQGRVVHNLVIDTLDLSSGLLQPDEVVSATFVVPDDEVEFVCTLHRGMRGTLVPG